MRNFKKSRGWFLLGLIAVVALFGVQALASNDDPAEIFRLALKNGNVKELNQMIAPAGLVLVRSYNPSNPNRGKDVLVRVTQIPANLQITVPNEFSFDFKYLFGGSMRAKTVNYLDQRVTGISLNDRTPANVRSFAAKVMELVNQKSRSFAPTVVAVENRWVVLTEAEYNDGILSGSMAIFEKSGDGYGLRVVVDLR